MEAIAKPSDHLPKEVFGKRVIGTSSRAVDACRRRAATSLETRNSKKATITTTVTAKNTGFIARKVHSLNRISERIIEAIIAAAFSNAKIREVDA
jgi:hypothetical protein